MIEALYNYFEAKSGMDLDEEQRELIDKNFITKRLLKKQYMLQEGDVCKYMGFIASGAARMFSINDKGQENIVRFGIEDWWIGDSESYMLGEPSKYNVEMLEDSILLLVTWENMQDLIQAIPAVMATTKALDKQSFISSQKRIHAAISMSAEERYEDLIKTYPKFLQRFPQNMIASYLGISAETLSRLKKNYNVR